MPIVSACCCCCVSFSVFACVYICIHMGCCWYIEKKRKELQIYLYMFVSIIRRLGENYNIPRVLFCFSLFCVPNVSRRSPLFLFFLHSNSFQPYIFFLCLCQRESCHLQRIKRKWKKKKLNFKQSPVSQMQTRNNRARKYISKSATVETHVQNARLYTTVGYTTYMYAAPSCNSLK